MQTSHAYGHDHGQYRGVRVRQEACVNRREQCGRDADALDPSGSEKSGVDISLQPEVAIVIDHYAS